MFGPRLNSWAKLDIPQPVIIGRELVGTVSHVDAFGNLITNIRERELFQLSRGRSIVIRAGEKTSTV